MIDRDTIEAVVVCYGGYRSRHDLCKPHARCSNNYFDRGIIVCGEWHDPLTFIKWALGPGDYAKGLSIDRLNNDKGYYPWNCYYVTVSEQQRNTRTTKLSMVKVREIRALATYLSRVELAELYEYSRSDIGRIVRNEIWKELEPVPRPTWVVSDEEILDVIRLHSVWQGMKRRVKPGYVQHKDYYDRGITVCEEWHDDFVTFFVWAVANEPRQGLSLDRIDNNGNYCPENCQFATSVEQNNNRQFCVKAETVWQIERTLGETSLLFREIAKVYNIGRTVICDINQGDHFHNTFPKVEIRVVDRRPLLDKKLIYQIEDVCDNMKLDDPVVAKIYGFSRSTVRRIRHGTHCNSDGLRVQARSNRVLPDKKLIYQVEDVCDNMGLFNYEIAEIYGVSITVIREVRHGTHWNSDPGRAALVGGGGDG